MNKKEIVKSIFNKTMESYDDYSWGVSDSGEIAIIIDNQAEIYNDYDSWLLSWVDDICSDILHDNDLLSKQEYLYIYKLLNPNDLRNKENIEIIEDYLCKEEKKDNA